ncbi:hypothetical protein JAAARDRAFT_385310 [Jaapia argillacea MUCL 33604]|uniref:Secreted protein n=1 Tax=Jaapia argillacea MUCL 33604 TaxID=933084 RepID=A0A067QLW5_9AGAM|nr:hypothetical protein JAAARDRAFT_385310 [Jaapia argillacea MUCL 33604]
MPFIVTSLSLHWFVFYSTNATSLSAFRLTPKSTVRLFILEMLHLIRCIRTAPLLSPLCCFKHSLRLTGAIPSLAFPGNNKLPLILAPICAAVL